MIAATLDHLWQSTLFMLAAGLLTLTVRANGAHVRYGIWLAASVKFLIPFAWLAFLASHAAPHGVIANPVIDTPFVQAVAQPFSSPAPVLALPPAPDFDLTLILFGLWSLGFVALFVLRLTRWIRIERALWLAAPLPALQAPVPVKSSSYFLEPGLIGIRRPALMLPDNIAAHLSADELAAVLAHEFCHLRRRDNLTALIHMVVEALFWFYPPVWWIGARLIAAREQACDEDVVAAGNAPAVYAESILKVCRLYVQSPLASVAGVSGADLKKRITAIMSGHGTAHLSPFKKFLLAASALAVLALPLAAGVLTPVTAETPPVRETEASLRRYIESLEKGQPNYDEMTSGLADNVREQLPTIRDLIAQWGALKTITFKGINGQGADIYEVTFEHGEGEWFVARLLPNGKVGYRGFRKKGTQPNLDNLFMPQS